MQYLSTIKKELNQAQEVLETFLSTDDNLKKISEAAILIANSMKSGGKVISCGNGGSHCDAMHFAEELTGRFRDDRGPLPAIAVSDGTHISCTANDYGFQEVFARFVQGLGRTGDVLLGISTSGNSENVIRAFEVAESLGMKKIALTGKDGGRLAPMADIEIRVPHSGYSDRIQEVHIKIIHILILLIEKEMS